MFFKNKNMQQNQLQCMDEGAHKFCMKFSFYNIMASKSLHSHLTQEICK